MKYLCLVLGLLLVFAGCASTPQDSAAESARPVRVSYLRDSGTANPLPGLTATILDSNIDLRMDWDAAHNQFLEELMYTGIFRSVVLEPEQLVDYGARFSLSELPDGAMQVQLAFINMHTGDTVFSSVTQGNRRNGNFGLAYVEGTGTSPAEAAELQKALVESIGEYRIAAQDMSGTSIAVMQPLVDASELTTADADSVDAFNSFVDGRYVIVVEDMIFSIANAELEDRSTIDRVVGDLQIGPDGRFDQGNAVRVGVELEADFVLISRVAYHPDGSFLMSFKIIETANGEVFRSSTFQANLWSDEATAFDIGTNIDRMFHTARPTERVTGTVSPVPESEGRGTEPAVQVPAGSDGFRSGFGLVKLEIDPIFPVFHSFYDRNPLGNAVLTNQSDATAENIVLSFYIAQYMDNPKLSEPITRLEASGSAIAPIQALFTSEILDITEDTRLSASIRLTYTMGGQNRSEEFIQSIEVLNRNALTWEDNRRIAAFVTSRDPAIMSFARNVSSIVDQTPHTGVNENLVIAAGLHEALSVHGLRYVPDPVTGYAEYSKQPTAVDYVLFPRQTLEFRGGDCDDLSALYSALLESVGIETAFITTPGHIFVAVSLGMDPASARRTFAYPDDLIVNDHESWLPVEVTVRNRGFLDAWQEGVKEWRRNEPEGLAGFYPVHASWEVYQPVGLPGSMLSEPLDRVAIERSVSAQITRFTEREVQAGLSQLQERAAADPGNPNWPNRLGILFGRFGSSAPAIAYFERALELQDNYTPALLNLGHLLLRQGDAGKALEFYQSAQTFRPNEPQVLLAIARANYAIENYGTANAAYDRLREVAPEMADQFAYLEMRGQEAANETRAGGLVDTILWSDDEEQE